MEKNIISEKLDIIVINSEDGAKVFEIKESSKVNKQLFTEIEQDYSVYNKGSIVIYPDQKIIETEKSFIDV